ncbi:potassium channel family protein [Staphylothermus hellenicus]|uniref:PhoU family protein n=1 Tax=Staphylothermus hellenicus (strain DSM 12710 / JCM 10830 / BK20S6-10-b1 / P8) TaxID=591019 RepID=D7DB46_STAHD|nr:TrkA C-terminal domain-containing protein [Staphylothermus hellenicus]ADI31393.1 PhoU family protein [Staphylothermus hellenicus DSM 12710]
MPLKAPRPVKYEPIPVIDLLMEMNVYSRLMLDLAYYSVVVKDTSIAYEVQRIEDKLDADWSLLVMQASLAVRSARDAEEMVSVYRMANALDKLSDSAADIAMLVIRDIGISEPVRAALLESEEVVTTIKVQNKGLEGFSVGRLYEIMTGFNILAIRRDNYWIINPGENEEIRLGDILIVRGTLDSLNTISNILGDKLALKKPVVEERENKIAKKIAYMKNITDVMIDLAFHAVVNNDKLAAIEVLNLEEIVDDTTHKMILTIIEKFHDNPEEAAGLLSFVISMENVADAAAELVTPLASNLPIHPIVKSVEEESIERIVRLKIPPSFKETSLGKLGLDELGAIPIAIYRGRKIIPLPNEDTVIKPNDILIVKIYSGMEENLNEKLDNYNIEIEGIEIREEED